MNRVHRMLGASLAVLAVSVSSAAFAAGGEAGLPQLKIGTWQSVILAEFDGARKRTVAVQVVGDE